VQKLIRGGHSIAIVDPYHLEEKTKDTIKKSFIRSFSKMFMRTPVSIFLLLHAFSDGKKQLEDDSPIPKLTHGQSTQTQLVRLIRQFDGTTNKYDVSDNDCQQEEAAAAIKLVGVVKALQAFAISEDANSAASNSGFKGAKNGKQDAFRHVYWSCKMTQGIGASAAKAIGDNHEKFGMLCGGQTNDAKEMDLYNNKIGRDLAINQKGFDCNKGAKEAVNSGVVKVIDRVPSSVPSKTSSSAPSKRDSASPSIAQSFVPSKVRSFVPSKNSFAPTKRDSASPSIAQSFVPSKSPSSAPSETQCTGLEKNQCKKKRGKCMFSKKKWEKNRSCLPKEKKWEYDCSRYDYRGEKCKAIKRCSYHAKKCVHKCNSPSQVTCRKTKIGRIKICMFRKKPNPCYNKCCAM